MKIFKENHESKAAQSTERIREETFWKNRMKSKKILKMSQGAANIFRMIKERCKWGEKSFLKNKFWKKRRPWKKDD